MQIRVGAIRLALLLHDLEVMGSIEVAIESFSQELPTLAVANAIKLLQACKYKAIFNITCSHLYCQIHNAYA